MGGLAGLRRFSAALLLGPALLFQIPRAPVVLPPAGLRVALLDPYDDPRDWSALREAGANVVAAQGAPDARTDELAGMAGLTYLAFLTTDEIQVFAADESRVAAARAQANLAGFYFWDVNVLEGFETPETQQRAYSTLKQLFPDKLVIFPTRLDPISWSSGFLDQYFRPEFTDLVTPYYYPVGTTIIGEAQEWDPVWVRRLTELVTALAYRVPPGKDLLPVLQGFEQQGYPVSSHFLADQFAVYRGSWPTLANAAVFAWRFRDRGSLEEIAGHPVLEKGVCLLFTGLSRAFGCHSRRELVWR